jgi:transposase InsO family protein
MPWPSASAFLPAAERFLLIDQLADQHSVAWLCPQLGVARSVYDAWLQRQVTPGQRAAENARLTDETQAIVRGHRGFYGSPRVHQALPAAGHPVGRHRVARLMQRAQLKARTRQPFRPCSVAAGFSRSESRCWAGDITDIRTTAGWRYLTGRIDLFSRTVVGWTLDQRMDAALVVEAGQADRSVRTRTHRAGQPARRGSARTRHALPEDESSGRRGARCQHGG